VGGVRRRRLDADERLAGTRIGHDDPLDGHGCALAASHDAVHLMGHGREM
jgi:hypothetical protein